MTPDYGPQESRLPIGQSPRWIMVYTFIGLGVSIAAMLLYGLPDGARSTVRWVHAIVPVLALAALASAYAPRRRELTPIDTGYLRVGIILLGAAGGAGALPLSFVAAAAFYLWTVVENRRAKRRGGHP